MKSLTDKEQDILASFILDQLRENKVTLDSEISDPEETHLWMLEEAHSEFESEHTEDIGLS